MSFSADGASANENDLWFTYTVTTSSGASFAGATDYYFPGPGADVFSYKSAHTWEFSLAFAGSEAFPLSLFAGLISDDDKPVYLEAGLPLPAGEGMELGLHAGMVTAASGFYDNEGASVVNLGITVRQGTADHRILRASDERVVRHQSRPGSCVPGIRDQPGAVGGPVVRAWLSLIGPR